jgi:quinol monooxygenase YgiN
MLIRIVRMTFQPDQTENFLQIFRESMHNIRQFPGCTYLELLQDVHQPEVYYTCSHWTDAAALEAYRRSELFSRTWMRTKALFAGKPQAFSLESAIRVQG